MLQQTVQIELGSLETLASLDVLDTVTGFYQLQVVSGTLREMNDRLSSIRFQDETRAWHFDLWNTIRDDSRFRFVPNTIPSDLLELGAKPENLTAFMATYVAREQGLPLLADDRMCQAYALNDSKNPNSIAFGSDVLICALTDEGRLDSESEADCYLNLMRWRYRFLVTPARVLKTLASRYSNFPPGKALREIAKYLHDCLRDRGLFSGREDTELGESLAMRFYLAWGGLCAEFLVEVWKDDQFNEDSATKLTQWCVGELFPSEPRSCNGQAKVRASAMTAKLLASHFLLQAYTIKTNIRAAKALQTLQEALNLSDEDYATLITGILNDVRRN